MLPRTMQTKPWHAHYDQGVPVHIDYRQVPVSGMLARTAARFPDRPALSFMNATFSFAELEEEVRRCAAALQRIGVKKGTRVAVQVPNIPQGVIAWVKVIGPMVLRADAR